MKQVGDVVRADIIEDYEGKSKGCGIVEFVDEGTALKAIKELDDTMLFDRPIFVREDREAGQPFRGGRRPPARDWHGPGYGGHISADGAGVCVIVTNLQWKTSWQDLKDLFKTCAPVNRVDVLTREDGKSRGIAKVYLQNEADANMAIATFNDYVLDGRKIGVKLDQR
ncbi:RNA recognition motif RRM containing protein [Babesia gibsoni]|uniref:RNA recognition motif RRM containing protein n=1 Tax=Babesia gibsoni TaxID=33632 RepID=A0AAD8LN86_BABGI|nr:RNA recognition motif RRM containing protein [Babesia gibsoni]